MKTDEKVPTAKKLLEAKKCEVRIVKSQVKPCQGLLMQISKGFQCRNQMKEKKIKEKSLHSKRCSEMENI